MPAAPRKPDVRPPRAVPGARIQLGVGASLDGGRLPDVSLAGVPARVVLAAPDRIAVVVPTELPGGRHAVVVDGRETGLVAEVASTLATDVHQVDSPAFDRQGRLYVTFSGTRGEQVPVSIFRVEAGGGRREPLVSGIVNPTSLALGPDGDLYVSSRFEGAVYRVKADGSHEVFATELGVACGLAFDADGGLFVGDRSGTIFRVDPGGAARRFATLPPSVAAFHLAFGPEGALYVTAPTANSYDHVYRVGRDGRVEVFYTGFGRPQGLAFDPDGTLHVAEALAGGSGIFRLTPSRTVEQVVSGHALVGVAFDAQGDMVVASSDTVYWFGIGSRRTRAVRAKHARPM